MVTQTTRFSHATKMLLPFIAVALACDKPTTLPVEPTPPPVVGPSMGSLQVVASTTGQVEALGAVTYSLILDGNLVGKIGINKTMTLPALPSGTHVVRLEGVAPGCYFVGANEVMVAVTAGGNAVASFSVVCPPAAIDLTSPDIAYVVGIDGAADIYVAHSNGDGAVRLTSQTGWNGDPAWSPDGKKIAFSGARDGRKEIYVMNADGTDQVRLTQGFAEAMEPAWSPDGTRIAFAAETIGYSWDKIFVMNADGTGVTSLSDGSIGNETSPDWSPDGSRIAFAGQFPGGQYDMLLGIGTMRPDGTDRRRVSSNYRDDMMPAWSPDGKRIAFAQTLYYTMDIDIVNADGTGKESFASGEDSADPTWSPDGKKIAFSTFSNTYGFFCVGGLNNTCHRFIRIIALDGSSSVILPAPGPAYDPTWRR